jgi:hypothetical protein
VADVVAVLEDDLGVGHQVAIPLRMGGRPAERADHGVAVTVGDPHQRRLAEPAGAPPDRGEDDHGDAVVEAALPPAGGLVPGDLLGDERPRAGGVLPGRRRGRAVVGVIGARHGRAVVRVAGAAVAAQGGHDLLGEGAHAAGRVVEGEPGVAEAEVQVVVADVPAPIAQLVDDLVGRAPGLGVEVGGRHGVEADGVEQVDGAAVGLVAPCLLEVVGHQLVVLQHGGEVAGDVPVGDVLGAVAVVVDVGEVAGGERCRVATVDLGEALGVAPVDLALVGPRLLGEHDEAHAEVGGGVDAVG